MPWRCSSASACLREARRVCASHARVDGRVCAERGGARDRSDHRGRGRRRASAGHDGRAYVSAGARRSGSKRRAQRPRFLLSIVQMPGGVPVGTLAIGKAGATNAGLLAVAILATSRPDLAREAARVPRRADRQGARGSAAVSRVVLPGATIGVLGSGQLGRMMAIAARRMGYRVHTFSPGEDTPTGQVADLEITADYEDLEAIRTFAQGGARHHVRVRKRTDRGGGGRRRDRAGAPERCVVAHDAAASARESLSRRSRDSRHALRRRSDTRRACRCIRGASAFRRSSRPPRLDTTARDSTAFSRSRTPSACGV